MRGELHTVKRLRAFLMNTALALSMVAFAVLIVLCFYRINSGINADRGEHFDMAGLTSDPNYESVDLGESLGVAFVGFRYENINRGFINSSPAVDELLRETSSQLRVLLLQEPSYLEDENGDVWKSAIASESYIYIKLFSELPHKVLTALLGNSDMSLGGESYMISELVVLPGESDTALYARNASGGLVLFECNIVIDTNRIFALEKAYHADGFDYSYVSDADAHTVALPFSSLSYSRLSVDCGYSRDESFNYDLLTWFGLEVKKASGDAASGYTYLTDAGAFFIGSTLTYSSSGLGINLNTLTIGENAGDVYSYLSAGAVLINEIKNYGYICDGIDVYLGDVIYDNNTVTLKYGYSFDNIAFGDDCYGRVVIKNGKIEQFSFSIIERADKLGDAASDNPSMLYYYALSEKKCVVDLRPIYTLTDSGDYDVKWYAFALAGGDEREI